MAQTTIKRHDNRWPDSGKSVYLRHPKLKRGSMDNPASYGFSYKRWLEWTHIRLKDGQTKTIEIREVKNGK
jgi:hypothetical protein